MPLRMHDTRSAGGQTTAFSRIKGLDTLVKEAVNLKFIDKPLTPDLGRVQRMIAGLCLHTFRRFACNHFETLGPWRLAGHSPVVLRAVGQALYLYPAVTIAASWSSLCATSAQLIAKNRTRMMSIARLSRRASISFLKIQSSSFGPSR